MARTKEFDETAVLDKALDLFWRQGYEATSVRDLTAELGISSSSLYATFGDKHAVYLQALSHYRAVELAEVRAQLANGARGADMLRHLFDALIDTLLATEERSGSFTLNAAVELGTRDTAVAEQLRDHLDDLTEILGLYLLEAQSRGEIDDRFAPDDLARYVLHNLYSLGTIATVYLNRDELQRLAAIILSTMEPACGPSSSCTRALDEAGSNQNKDNQS
jgi:TetR/AcrR family transcriptional repressor of nem operon